MMGERRVQAFTIPGTRDALLYERTDSGRLIRLSCNGRTYLHERDGERILGDGLAIISEVLVPHGLLRHVRAAGESWTEEYLWDAAGRPVRIDGVEVRRDDRNRVTACLSPLGDWLYAYAGDDLAAIEGPFGVRHLTRGVDGRPVRVRQGAETHEIAYDAAHRRLDLTPVPANWHRDELGRLWTITGSDGAIRTTYLWDGFACLGRIDGPPGEPLAAVFSLDPSCTPVRIISKRGVTRIPRDAFGEGLFAHCDVPGLYGGAIYDGFVHLRARALDPRTGAFNAPDPWHGLEDDPRRAEGYRGPLMVENPAAGPYAVCQNDPIGRADPTGQVSFLLILSDLTWSLQNNLLGWLGLDAAINFWGSLFSGNMGRFFSYDGLSSDRLGSFGVRRDGVVTYKNPPRAWTYQHIVWSVPEEIEELADVRVFDPKGEFRPTLYGTLLRAVPSNGDPFVLRGARNPGNIAAGDRAPNWTRAGGKAEPVVPGSPIPHFPRGGIHLDDTRQGLRGPQNCTLTELEPTGALGSGTIDDRAVIVVPATGLGLSTDDLVLLTDAGANVAISRVLSAVQQGEATRIRLGTDAPGVGPDQVRVRGLGAPSSSETLNPVPAASPRHLDAAGTAAPYTPGDPLRLSQGGSEVGAALIQRLESRVQIDAALPGDLTPPLTAALAPLTGSPNPAVLTADAQVLEFPAGQPIAGVGETIAVTDGGSTIPVVVTGDAGGRQRRVDRDLSALGSAGDAVTWQQLTRGTELGTRDDAPEGSAVVTYEPLAPRTAPSTGFLRIEDNGGRLAVRGVASLAYDALVLGAPLPGNPANPYDVERFPIQPPDHDGLSITREQVLALDPSVNLGGVALQLHRLSGPDIAAATAAGSVAVSGVNVVGSVASFTFTPGTARPTNPTPSQLVVLTDGTNQEPALVRHVRVTYRFDRDLRLGSSGLEAVPLMVGSPAYRAVRRDVLLVTVLPEVAGARVQMPRFGVGELVEANWTGAATPHRYRVTAVEGTTLTLEGDADLPATTPDLTITRLVPDDPGTGGSRAGIEGVPVNLAPDGTTRQVRFQVWGPDALPGGQVVGIVDGAITLPTVVDSVLDLEIEFAAAPGLTGAGMDITVPAVTDTGYAASFTQVGAAVIHDDPAPLPAGTDLVVAIPFQESTDPARRAENGQLGPGTVLVPEDPENWELDRRQSLIDHELRHTQQSAMWGPLLLGWFPLFAIEGILEATTDFEMPEFSPYVPGTVQAEGPNRFLEIPDFQGIAFEAGDHVQISWVEGGQSKVKSLRLGQPSDGNKFRIDAGPDVPSGGVQVRRQVADNFWTDLRDVLFNASQLFTHGGVLNLLAGSTYGGLIFGLGKLFYALGRLIFGAGDNYPATVEEEGRALRLSDDAGRSALQGASRIIVQSGESTLVRSVSRIEDGVVRLTSAIDFRDEVRVAPYSTHTPESHWDWHDYFPARVPDLSRPASIRIFEVDGRRLNLSPFDRVTVTAGTVSRRTNVTAVAADGTVELEEPPPTTGDERDFRIAKIDERDPMGNADSWAMTELGMGWMRWAFDPYGQLHYCLQPERGSFWDVLARIGRYLFGSTSWSALFPPGWFIWDNAIKQAGTPSAGHLSQMEQDASEESGDLYSPVGRLRGSAAVVGDVARYWHFVWDRQDTVIMRARQDAPGVHVEAIPRVVPSLDTTGPGTDEPNRGARVDPTVTDPGRDVPDVFFDKDNTNPNTVNATNPDGFAAAARGWVPVSPALERTCGIYAAFSRPGRHRITVRNNIPGAGRGREAQEEEMQTLFFDRDVDDVEVAVAGLPVSEGDTITLVQTQRATIAVRPDGERRYAVTLTRPGTGDVLRADGDLVVVARMSNGVEPAEISRVYRYDEANDAFDSGGLKPHGIHLPGDVHVPVRSFSIEVVNTLPVRRSISTDPAVNVTTRLPGEEGFVLVPAAILSPLRLASVTYPGGAPAGITDPSPAVGVESVPEDLRAFIGDGSIFKVTFAANDPPEERAELEFRVDVGVSGNSANLEARVELAPHFRLVLPAGGSVFQVQRGTSITLRCTDGVNAGAVVVTPSAGVTTTVAGADVTLTVDGTAATGFRRVLIDDAADATRKARRTIEITT